MYISVHIEYLVRALASLKQELNQLSKSCRCCPAEDKRFTSIHINFGVRIPKIPVCTNDGLTDHPCSQGNDLIEENWGKHVEPRVVSLCFELEL
jgi:hypothetical protein